MVRVNRWILAVSFTVVGVCSAAQVEQSVFSKDFLWGTATCEYQNSGAINCPDINWADWEKTAPGQNSHIEGGQQSGTANDHWNRVDEDITLMKKLGVNAYRFSIDWGRVEPEEGLFNQEALNHYSLLCNKLIANGITPMVTLHHFTHPRWFEKKGAFEKEENIPYFVRFSMRMFALLKDRVSLWCTINEPTIYTMQGYVRGVFPPGKTSPGLAGEVLKNLLKAHCSVYHILKVLPGGQEMQIGIVHSLLKFEPYHWYSPIENGVCKYFTHIVHGALKSFFKTGSFSFYTPWGTRTTYSDPLAPESFDFVGLNYYSRAVININWDYSAGGGGYPGEVMTDMPYASYPEGFRQALLEMAELGKPIYVTENGIADAKDDRRADFIRDYIAAMAQAKKEGCDVRGYFYWTLMDNFEWDMGFDMRFGLYEVDFETKERTLRKGAEMFRDVVIQAQADAEAAGDISPATQAI